MHGAVPRSLELVKGPGGEQREGKNGVQAHRAGVGTCRRTDRQRHVATRRECRWGHRSGGPGAVSRKDSPLLTQDWGGGGCFQMPPAGCAQLSPPLWTKGGMW